MAEFEEGVMTAGEKIKAFMIGLTKLTKETGVVIGGCGCCGSPYVSVTDAKDIDDARAAYGYGYAGEVAWLTPTKEDSWESFSDSIVR